MGSEKLGVGSRETEEGSSKREGFAQRHHAGMFHAKAQRRKVCESLVSAVGIPSGVCRAFGGKVYFMRRRYVGMFLAKALSRKVYVSLVW